MFTQKFMQEIERSFEAQLNRLGERKPYIETYIVWMYPKALDF